MVTTQQANVIHDGKGIRKVQGGNIMLTWAIIFAIIAVVAALFGFGGAAGTAATIAKVLFAIFLILAVISFLF
jgi:uncharacterized membrane protein YtjA (UPF0391 family)